MHQIFSRMYEPNINLELNMEREKPFACSHTLEIYRVENVTRQDITQL